MKTTYLVEDVDCIHCCQDCPWGLYGDYSGCNIPVLMSESPDDVSGCKLKEVKVVRKWRSNDDFKTHIELVVKEHI